MRRLFHLGWLAATLGACALGTAADDSTMTSAKDAGPKLDASQFPKDASAPQQDASSFVDASLPGDDAATQNVDSGNNNTTCATPFNGTLATFDFTNEPGNQTSTAASSTAAGVSAGALARSSALTAVSGASSINASNWTTASKLDATRYYTFTLTPKGGCTLDVSSLSITTAASKTGPTLAAAATSDDNFATTSSVSVGATATPTLSVSGATGAVEVRVYGWSASSTSGTLRVTSTLTVAGSLQ